MYSESVNNSYMYIRFLGFCALTQYLSNISNLVCHNRSRQWEFSVCIFFFLEKKTSLIIQFSVSEGIHAVCRPKKYVVSDGESFSRMLGDA